jgi:hypothetical protein
MFKRAGVKTGKFSKILFSGITQTRTKANKFSHFCGVLRYFVSIIKISLLLININRIKPQDDEKTFTVFFCFAANF